MDWLKRLWGRIRELFKPIDDVDEADGLAAEFQRRFLLQYLWRSGVDRDRCFLCKELQSAGDGYAAYIVDWVELNTILQESAFKNMVEHHSKTAIYNEELVDPEDFR